MTSSRKSGVPGAAFVSTIPGNIYMVAVIGLNTSVYGTLLNVTAGVGLGLFFAGALLFAIAISRSGSLPRNAGIPFAASVPVAPA